MDSNTTINRYGSIATEIYDIDKPFGALPDTRFHLERFKGFAGPILEPACGSGRTLIPLLEAGCEVAGFDPSDEMLASCRTRCAERGFAPDLSRQRFEDFTYDRRFAAILVPAGSFTLIDRFEPAMAALRRFFDHLAPGGMVVLDIQPLSFLAGRNVDRRQWVAGNGDLLTIEGEVTRTDWAAQRTESRQRYERWRDNRLVDVQLEPMAQRYWGLEEFALALAAAGFSDIQVSGGYERGRPVRSTDHVMTFEAVRN
ncbi:MAG TPA: class I SAM-dependent methyltransferase [Caulobacteraceae bacterium]